MYFTKTNYENDLEILASNTNLVTFSGTVLQNGVTANSEGKKYVLTGSLIDADGNVVKAKGDALTGTPKGILYRTVNVTHGDQPCSLIVEGYLRVDRVLDGYSEAAITAIKTALPKITFM
ncbi:hypothetical protein FDB28_05855 [Clostridium botulinum]|nr:hypothetical protein [Clostridium botulinum]NFS95385.1 hypothetical protein [Clostridium botulinum]